MIKPDIIFLSNTKDIHHYGLTTRAINTLRASEAFSFNEIIVETNAEYLNRGFIYNGSTVVIPNEDFNYNKFLNIGLKYSTSDWVIIANNDVIFTQNWFTNLMDFQSKNPQYLSLSPYEPNWHIEKGMHKTASHYAGYRTSYEITGWCIVIHRSVIDKCELFDEQFKFWYQDNDYAETIRHAKIQHALVTNSRVYHDISKSYDTMSAEKLHEMTHAQTQIFYKKWPQNS